MTIWHSRHIALKVTFIDRLNQNHEDLNWT
jgi:hypothetical protein